MASKTMKPVFVTRDEGANELVKAVKKWLADPSVADYGTMPMAEFRVASGWDYSRTWQVARRLVLEAKFSHLLVPVGEIIKANPATPIDDLLAPLVRTMRDEHAISWGEINVRMGITEGRVRKLYKHQSTKKDIGLRIGKGGRFAYADPTLYLGNMKAEGAWIPAEAKGRVAAEKCLNYKKPTTKRVRQAKAVKVEAPTNTVVEEAQVEAV